MERPIVALYQPDIPQNCGTIVRLGACLRVPVHIIEPAGFTLSDRAFRRAGLDYVQLADVTRHVDWAAFCDWRQAAGRRLILMTTRATRAYYDFAFHPSDILLMGRESAGVPENVHAAADHRLAVPLKAGARSLNVAVSAAMALGEALRQTDAWP